MATTKTHHFFVQGTDIEDGTVRLTGDEAHHAARVLRVRPGEAITVADGSGTVFEAVVRTVGRTVEAEIERSTTSAAVVPGITLVQAVAKGDRMDVLVEKAVEVGVGRIVPVIAERSVVRWDETRRERARRRWTEVARAAAKQCGSARLTEIAPVSDDVASVVTDGVVVVLDPGARTRLRDALPDRAPEAVSLVVGPEGGFTASELELLTGRGATLASLGERVLRSDTAGPIAAALVLYAYGALA